MDKTPHIAEEQIIMTMDKAQETKLQDYEVTHTQTHTQTNCYNPPPTLRLIMVCRILAVDMQK